VIASRRDFLEAAGRGACALGAFGLGIAALAPQSQGAAPVALRPPGAREAGRFLAACARCGLCARACPYDTLRLARLADDAPAGTPIYVARDVPCEMCPDIPCVVACPTGALDKSLVDIAKARMGTAVLTSPETCLNVRGLRCDVCYRVCPLIEKAITLEAQHNAGTGRHARLVPVVHAEACTGCGKCEKSCVLEEAAIKVLPVALAASRAGKHDVYGNRARTS